MNKHLLNTPIVYKYGTKWSGFLPALPLYLLGRYIADLSYLFCRSARTNVKKNLRLVFPDISEKKLSFLARNLFRNYSRYLIDYCRFTNLNKRSILDQITYYEGKQNLELALQMNKGLLLLTAHLGNWELGGIFFGSYGLKINVLTLPDENPEIGNIRSWYREIFNVKTITIGESPFSSIEMVKALSNNELIAMLIDRYDGKTDGIIVDFFKKPTQFPRGPLILSRLTGAPIVVAFVVKEKKTYTGVIKGPFIVTHEKEEYEIMKNIVNILEEYINMYPDQWYNFTQV